MKLKRNVFDLSHEHKLTCDMGKLIPIMCEEVIPGDTFKVKTDIVIRLAPLLAPVMHRVDVFTHFFYVPTRLVFDKWDDFITGGEKGQYVGEDADTIVPPYITAPEDGFVLGSLADYLGLPVGVPGIKVSAMPFRAYDLIYNEWYRDEDNIDPLVVDLDEGEDTTTSTSVQFRAWEKDYFTSSQPWTQKGTAVSLPLGSLGMIPVVGDGSNPMKVSTMNSLRAPLTSLAGTADVWTNGSLSTAPTALNANLSYSVSAAGSTTNVVRSAGLSNATLPYSGTVDSGSGLNITDDKSKTTVFADATNVGIGSATINDLRLAMQVQKWMEKNARAGSRLVETILAHFGVRVPDARLQRPEYLGGGRSPIIFSEVLQTSKTDGSQPLGQMGGHGFAAQRTHQFKRFFTEHGFVIGIMSIMPRTSYSQGIRKMWSRETRYDYYWPLFAHLGEQAILNKEIYAQSPTVLDGDIPVNEEVFGYQNRYDEYRRRESQVHGLFRQVGDDINLSFWQMGRYFTELPELNADFINCDPTKSIFAVPTEDGCIVDIYHNIKAIRPIPKRGTPGGL